MSATTETTVIRSSYPDVAVPDVDLPTFLLAKAAELGDEPAFVDGPTGRTVTFDGLARSARRFAAGLAVRGFAPGDVLAVLVPNCPEWPVAVLGAQLAGGAVTPVNPLWTAGEIGHQVRDCDAKMIFTVGPFLAAARAAAPEATVILLGEQTPGTVNYAELLAGDAPAPDLALDPATTVALLPYSSGTTGLPKGVRLTHRAIVANICQTLQVLSPRPDDVLIGALPFFHVAGFCSSVCLTLRVGASVVTMPRFDLQDCLRLIETHRATVLPAAPPMVLALARHPLVDRFDLSSLEVVISSAAPLSAELEAQCSARLGRPVVQAYGMTEASPVLAISRRDGRGRTPGSVGELVPNTQVRIVDALGGADLAPGRTGELWFRGPQVMAGYLNDAEATAATVDAEGWLHTGDLGTVSAEGEVMLVDRVKDLIKVSGFPVAPAELEALLAGHPAVADVAVVGRPDPQAGQRPVAFVVPREGADLGPDGAPLIEWAAERTAGYKRLGGVVVVDAIPRSPAGKILRRMLRTELSTDPT